LVDVLFGEVNPSGKLPCAFPKSEDQLPFFDREAVSIEYGYDQGYRLMDKEGHAPAFPFGFGLSYTTYEYSNLSLERDEIGLDGMLQVGVEITNRGQTAGEEIAQLYVGYPPAKVDRPVKELKGFARIGIQPGETWRVEFSLPARRLAYYDEQGGWTVEPGDYELYVGPSSDPGVLLASRFRIRAG
jgi:beta-glucosidase